jgi:hypothetical protein
MIGSGRTAAAGRAAPVVIDTTPNTLALDASVDAPALIKVMR